MPSSLHIEAVAKWYGPDVALDDVSLEIPPGEMLALLGPSGCGKTTLLRAIAGLNDLDRGQIHIGNTDVTSLPTRQRPIGMVFQHYALFPNLTVEGNIAFPLKIRRQPRDEIRDRVGSLLDLVGLTVLSDRFPSQLSGGQQQRVALARALAPEPEVLLLDEPLAALDAAIRNELRDEIRRIQHRVGTTAVFVTHDQSEAMAIADRVAVMKQGRIVECASPSEIYDRPKSQFAATFVGSRNILELPIGPDRMVRWGEAFSVMAPDGANGAALAVFRPEDVRFVERGGMVGSIDVVVFLGPVSRVYVSVGEHTVHIDVSSRDAASLTPGRQVSFVVPSDAIRVFASA